MRATFTSYLDSLLLLTGWEILQRGYVYIWIFVTISVALRSNKSGYSLIAFIKPIVPLIDIIRLRL